MGLEAKVFERRDIYRGRLFELLIERVKLPNGCVSEIERIRHPGAAAIVPLLPDYRVVMIKQYRHSVGQDLWEIPAGTMNPDESPFECAKRELREETGFEAEWFQKLAEIFPVPGYSDERIHLYRATGLTPVKQALDEDEILEIHPIPFEEVLQMIVRGDIQDAKSISGLFLASRLKPQKV